MVEVAPAAVDDKVQGRTKWDCHRVALSLSRP